MKLEGKVALVTGSSQGIGQAITTLTHAYTIRLAFEGANIIIDYRSHPQAAEQTKADLSNISDVRQLVAGGIQHFGLDILANNAGLEKKAAFKGSDKRRL